MGIGPGMVILINDVRDDMSSDFDLLIKKIYIYFNRGHISLAAVGSSVRNTSDRKNFLARSQAGRCSQAARSLAFCQGN